MPTWCSANASSAWRAAATGWSCSTPTATGSPPEPSSWRPGSAWRRLGVPRLEQLVGSGVYYGTGRERDPGHGGPGRLCCRRRQFGGPGRAAPVPVRPAGDAPRQGDSLARSMSDYLVGIEATSQITVRLETVVIDGDGADHLEAVTLLDGRSGQRERVPAAALFVVIGGEPRTDGSDTIRLDRGIPTGPTSSATAAAIALASRPRPFPARDVHARCVRGGDAVPVRSSGLPQRSATAPPGAPGAGVPGGRRRDEPTPAPA